ncbi:MAG: ribose ABC transporter permease [Gemmatimonadetes bacterium]|jgi:ribose transport system permease protein|nr:ribose ABC transporter permease [Gemmatimonadota bacterium]
MPRRLLSKLIHADQAGLALALLLLCGVLSTLSPVFLTTGNITNILRDASLVAIAGFGMVVIILQGEIDLSVGSSQAVVGILTVVVLNTTHSVAAAIVAGILLGALVGLVNGLLVTVARINSLIATLGMMAILRGVAMVGTDAVSIQARVTDFVHVGTGYVGGVPVPVLIAAVLYGGVWFLLHHTPFGRYVYAVGGNREAAELAGLPVLRIRVTVFVLGGMLAALSAVVLASRMNSGQPNAGLGFELQVIAAVVLGGVSLTGGVGSLLGALIGILILTVLNNGLVLLNVSSFYHDIARGVVIILAVYLDTRRRGAAVGG